MIFMEKKFYILGSAGVPPAELGVAPGSFSNDLGQSSEASGVTPAAARETRALPKN